VTHIYSRQPSDSRRAEASPLDAGLPDFGGCESMMIFDDVFVPDERVFLCGEAEYTQELVRLFGSFHRFCYGGCKVGIADVVIGAASLAARANGVRDRTADENKQTEMVNLNETMYSCVIAAALE
jgi:4-hydroxybutyryl-CoA dehydratase/vinylacetyl-CoA-Delta-isomerase